MFSNILIFQTLLGVVSWGNKCATEHYPGVNVGVSHFVEWIEYTMEQNSPTTSSTTIHNQSSQTLSNLSYLYWILFFVHRMIPDFP